jgi:hypothetical protein
MVDNKSTGFLAKAAADLPVLLAFVLHNDRRLQSEVE